MFYRCFFYEIESQIERLSTGLTQGDFLPPLPDVLTSGFPVGTMLMELLSMDAEKLTRIAETCPQYTQVKEAVEEFNFPLERSDKQYGFYRAKAREDSFFVSLLEQSCVFNIHSFSSDEFLIYEILHFKIMQEKYKYILRLLQRLAEEQEELRPMVFYDYLADEEVIPHADTLLALDIFYHLHRSRPMSYNPLSLGENLDRDYNRFVAISNSTYMQKFSPKRSYFVSNFDDLFSIGLFHSLHMGFHINICENCGKYFIPKNRSDALYCYRPSPQNPDYSCREYRLKRARYDINRMDEVERLSRNVYQAWLMRTKRRPYDLILKSRFKAFSQQRSQWRQDVKAGKATVEEFKAWLLKMREEM